MCEKHCIHPPSTGDLVKDLNVPDNNQISRTSWKINSHFPIHVQYVQGVQKTADSEWAIILAASKKFN